MSQTDIVQPSATVDACDLPSTPYDVALSNILSNIEPISQFERVPIREALHRVAAEDITANSDVPGHRNSAMDGYACQFADLFDKGDISRLKLVGTSAAGSPYLGNLKIR